MADQFGLMFFGDPVAAFIPNRQRLSPLQSDREARNDRSLEVAFPISPAFGKSLK